MACSVCWDCCCCSSLSLLLVSVVFALGIVLDVAVGLDVVAPACRSGQGGDTALLCYIVALVVLVKAVLRARVFFSSRTEVSS